ncbi:hypothetical protein [Stella sp.]|uniref:hypothetical protein n=1 Tax=Stella sp. TaxID=2912054 RepID=UPI0035B3437C
MNVADAEAAFADLLGRRRKFLEVVAALVRAGVRAYQVDFQARAMTLYGEDGSHHRVALALPMSEPISEFFSSGAIDRTILQMRSPEADFATFLRRMAQAGCAQYFVYLRGRRAIYLGVDGDQHVVDIPARA